MKCLECTHLQTLDRTTYYCDYLPEALLPLHLVEIEIEYEIDGGCKQFNSKYFCDNCC